MMQNCLYEKPLLVTFVTFVNDYYQNGEGACYIFKMNNQADKGGEDNECKCYTILEINYMIHT